MISPWLALACNVSWAGERNCIICTRCDANCSPHCQAQPADKTESESSGSARPRSASGHHGVVAAVRPSQERQGGARGGPERDAGRPGGAPRGPRHRDEPREAAAGRPRSSLGAQPAVRLHGVTSGESSRVESESESETEPRALRGPALRVSPKRGRSTRGAVAAPRHGPATRACRAQLGTPSRLGLEAGLRAAARAHPPRARALNHTPRQLESHPSPT
jgi:hypothetical protein